MSSTTLNGASEAFTSTAAVNGGNPTAATPQQATSSPEEIGWYFVESYYTNLNKSPDRLHLFYQKKSSFIWGTEGDTIPVSQGRQEISDRIKQLEFKDCKVRVTNVDSQGSGSSGIIVQVLGDMTNNSEPSRRFCQTFFLAEQHQPAGYYVLNDIFRFLKDEEDEEDVQPEFVTDDVVEAPAEAAPEPAPVPEENEVETKPAEEPDTTTADAEVSAEPEKVEEETPATTAEELVEPPAETEKIEEPVVVPVIPAVPAVPAVAPEATQPEAASETSVEIPKEVPPTAPPVAQEPVKPKSWAALLSGNKPAPVASQAPAPAPAATTTSQPAAAPTTASPATASTPSSQSNSGWQTTESRRQNRPVSISGAPEGQASAYVKGVNEKVTQQALTETLSKFGTVKNVDLDVGKGRAFVDFADAAALVAAAKANPHRVNGQVVFVEERHRRSNAPYSGSGRGGSIRGGERQGSRGSQRGPGDRDRFDSSRNSISGRGGPGGFRGGGFSRGGRGGASNAATSSN